MKFIRTVTEFYHFLCDPKSRSTVSQKLSFVDLNLLFGVSFLTILLVFIPIYSLLDVEDLQHNFDHLLENYNSFVLFIIVVIVAPIFEEFIFRYPLKYAFTALLFCNLSMFYAIYVVFDPQINVLVLVIIWLFLACLVSLLVYDYLKPKWIGFFNNHFGWIFYLHVVMFAFLHTSNFDIESTNWYVAPLLVIPQFILAMLLGYVRIQNNIWSSIYIHGLNNLIPMLPILYAMMKFH